ncbi:uncharacterized protein ARMOST_13983 [Armillaria ostoyae]|uniref:Uncharacterized protein n=1 Tax=Armillaria ostoyae TaxID=47428 RepID=A0A284RPF1_ARMOS|nr:uncharacterized protein ARMOST_13983 [Armillaria ostoyae]
MDDFPQAIIVDAQCHGILPQPMDRRQPAKELVLREILREGLCEGEKLGVDLFGGFRRRREMGGGGEGIRREGPGREKGRGGPGDSTRDSLPNFLLSSHELVAVASPGLIQENPVCP